MLVSWQALERPRYRLSILFGGMYAHSRVSFCRAAEGPIVRISEYVRMRSPLEGDGADYVRPSLLDLHGRRLAMEARAEVASPLPDIPGNSTRRRDFCVMSGHAEINTWEPARLPVVTTDISSTWIGYPSSYHLRSYGYCWVAPRVNVRWDNDWWTTTWHRWLCDHRQREYGTVGVGEVNNQAYNNDFPINTHRVWVSHIAQLHHDDYSGRIWYRGYAGTAGGVTKSMLASSSTGSNCY